MSETISFSTQQLASGLRSGTLAEPITTAQVGGPNTVTQRVVAAIVGDGDSLLESGETGFILANGSNLEGGITRTTLNGANDPVTVTAHGWARIRAVEPLYLNDYLTFTTDEGFKVSGANARPGNSITWTLNDKDGAAQKLDAAQFVVNTGGVTGPVSVAMDFDGDIIASGIYSETNAPAEAALTLQAQDGDVIAIDFLTNSLTLNGVLVTGTEIDQFFAAYTASAGNTLTIGSADTATFAVKDLTLERSDKTAAPNTAPFIAVSQVVSDILDGSDLADRVKVADIQILDDGIGTNILSLSGEDASLFEIIGTGLYLKAGTDIDLATNPTLRVFVTVEDQSLPDAPVSAEVVVQVRDAVTVESIISFGSVQLTAQPGNVVDPISTDNLGTGTDYRKQALIAIEGDGDRAFEAGETGYVLAALKDDLVHTRLTTLNTATDPVSITGHGWYRSSAVSQLNLNAAMVYDPVTGFRIELSSSRPGDSLTWHLNEKDGVAQKLALVSFVVHSAGTVSASFDVDGDVIQSGSYGNGRLATPDALLTINLNDGDIVRIDFATSSFTVNGQALPAGTASQFFSGFAASDQSTITIGGIGVGGFSVGDLTLHRGGGGTPPPTNLPPSVSLANIVASVAETRDMSVALKVADIVVTDDGMGTNVLGLTGANAALFEIVGTELFLKAGTVLDFETAQSLQVTVTVDDTTLGAAGSVEATVPFVLSVTDANEGPVVSLANVVASVSEAQDTSVPLKVADIVVTDDGIGSNILALSGTDAGLFEIVGTELFLKAGVALDFETLQSLSVSVDVDDTTIGTAGSVESSIVLTLPVGDANEPPVVTLANVVTGVAETQDLSVRLKVADIVVTDDALGTNALTLSGADAALFEIVGTELFLRAGTVLDFETVPSLSVSVDLDDTTLGLAGSVESTVGLTLAVTDANELPVVTLANVVASVSEGQDLAAPFKVADIVVTDDGIGTNTLVLSGADAALFEIVGTELFLKAGAVLDFETLPSLSISVDVDDTTIGASGSIEGSAPLTLPVTDANEAPVVTLTNVVASIPEDQNLTSALKVADIVVTDDALGTNALTLSGANAALFEIVGTELFLRAGTALDFETLASLSVSVDLDDTTIGAPGSIESSAGLSLAVTDVKETWGIIELDGAVGEWPAFSLLASDPSGAEVRGTYQDGAFIVALSTNGVPIGPNTTFWFDTDLNSATGYQVFGNTAGAEFNVNIGADGRPVLYTGADGETEVTPLIHKFSADGTVLEFALPSSLVGGATSANLFVDLNNSLFIPGNYADGGLPIGDNLSATVTLANQITSIPEDQNLTAALKVADIVVSDDTIGTNTLTLSGANAALFEIVGTELFLRAGTALDFETLASLSVSVDLDDTTIGAPGSIESSAGLSLAVTDVKETWGIIELDGAVGEWPAFSLLASDPSGAEVRGTYQDGAFIVALSTNGVPIGPNTTFWFDTDLNSATGYQVFGNTAGAEFNVNIGADGRPVLYTGADGETEVTPLIHKFSADGTVLEFALPSSLVGGATSANLFVDLNNSLFIPGNYADGGLPIGDNLSATVTLANQITSIPEDQNLTAALKVADIVVSDDTIGTNTLTLSGANAALFEIVGTELFLRAGTALDFETLASLSVSVDLDDTTIGAPGSIESSAGLSLAVTDVKETWGIIELDGAVGEWPGYTLLASDNTYEVRGTYQDGAFVIALSTGGAAIGPNTTFWLNTDLDAATGYQVFGSAVGAEYNINIGLDGRPALYSGAAGETLVSPLIFSFNADRSVLEFALPSDLVGGSAAAKLYLDVNDTVFIPGDYFSSTGLAIGDNIAPSVTLTPVLTQIAENANVSARTKVADVVVTDDGIGTNELKLSGADAALFEIVGSELFLKAGAALDFETNATLDVSVDVDDTTIGTAGSVEASAPLSVTVTDVEEQFGTITLDGSTAEWAANTQLYTRSTGGVDYTVHGTYGAGAFLIALDAETLEIGVDTTIWLNTDRNAATGFQVFGNGVGAEYNIEFEADGTLALYTGDAGQTLVSTLNYFFDADRGTVEIALPSTLVGGSTNLEMFIDVNNTTFLPEFYSSGGFVVRETTPVQPTDPAVRIAIVYSESSANAYFDKTAYGQLVMSAQNQAMQAGIPFDLISEADLTDIAKIKDYDAIVFPEFSHVEASLVQGIVDTLTEASQTYGIGFIASGNFMTNTDTGAVIGSDAYARMKSLLGVTLGTSGSTTGLTMNAEDVTHPISDGYTANELVGTYSNTGFQSFIDFNGTGQVLFTQTTTTQGEVAAVIATTTGGRNVHFASDAISGNNNVLQEAIQWSARGDLPEVSLEMTRGTSLFFSRNDMDQSQETFDVVVQNPGIYDAMLPIVQNWYEDYNFVGSYYINVGANPPDQQTNWAVSSPYYQQLLAMENEIGTHSYTHPENTNFLLPDVMTQAELDAAKAGDSAFSAAIGGRTLAQVNAEMAAALSASDPDTVTSVNLNSFSAVQRALLQHSFTFQWEYSRQIIEQQLGLSNLGGAVPGAPEQLYSTFNILPFVSYLTGGYAGVGAGYPGAFGFLDPNHTEQVYFAPNVSFDFSLIGFRNLTPTQAEEVWAQEYANITSHGGAPIIHFPWHDYGPTNWDIDEGNGPTYTQQMFTNFIERAYLDGTEFVTGADLAERILAFSQAQLSIEQSGSNLVVTATGGDLGTFALEMEEGLTIANVGNWYAYDDGKVFLDRDGGVYTVAFGSQSDDVTHIVKLPMRADSDLGLRGRVRPRVLVRRTGGCRRGAEEPRRQLGGSVGSRQCVAERRHPDDELRKRGRPQRRHRLSVGGNGSGNGGGRLHPSVRSGQDGERRSRQRRHDGGSRCGCLRVRARGRQRQGACLRPERGSHRPRGHDLRFDDGRRLGPDCDGGGTGACLLGDGQDSVRRPYRGQPDRGALLTGKHRLSRGGGLTAAAFFLSATSCITGPPAK